MSCFEMVDAVDTQIFEYVCNQARFFGELSADGKRALRDNIPAAIQQTQGTLDKFASTANKLDILHSHHSVIFIYKLARLIHENSSCVDVSEKLFLLNRMMSSIDLGLQN